MLRPRILDLNEVIEGTEAILRRALGEDAELVLDLSPGIGLVRADPSPTPDRTRGDRPRIFE